MEEQSKTNKLSLKQAIIWAIIAMLLIAGTLYFFYYRKIHPSTDDAYVQAHVVNIASQVSGQVTNIQVKNNQPVKAGAVLFSIEIIPYKNEVLKAKAGLRLAEQQMNASSNSVGMASAQLATAKADLIAQEKQYKRIMSLVENNQAAVSKGDDMKARLDMAKAKVDEAENNLARAQQDLGVKGHRNAQMQKAKAFLAIAEKNLRDTSITAPASGHITNFTLRVGANVAAGQPLFQLVEDQHWWVDANFKETQLERIRPKQPVTIKVDMYPRKVFHGYVDSISRGSGAAFSLLPPENASGNWVKVTQRFPVKIIIEDLDPDYPLRVGSSCKVTVDTTSNE